MATLYLVVKVGLVSLGIGKIVFIINEFSTVLLLDIVFDLQLSRVQSV